MQRHRFYAHPSSFSAGQISLDESEARHLSGVLRMGVGSEAFVFDGMGGEFRCVVSAIAKRGATLSVVDRIDPACPESPLKLTLAAAILKGDKFDLVIQKAVELGVDRIVPLVTVRGDAKAGGRGGRQDRWERIALEASKQCGRATLTSFTSPMETGEVLEQLPGCVLFSERGGSTIDTLNHPNEITALVGPEGGWDDRELSAADEAKAAIITLGGRILRAETASVAVTAILQNRFGDLN